MKKKIVHVHVSTMSSLLVKYWVNYSTCDISAVILVTCNYGV